MHKQIRQLAAIMFTDIVGNTALMGSAGIIKQWQVQGGWENTNKTSNYFL